MKDGAGGTAGPATVMQPRVTAQGTGGPSAGIAYALLQLASLTPEENTHRTAVKAAPIMAAHRAHLQDAGRLEAALRQEVVAAQLPGGPSAPQHTPTPPSPQCLLPTHGHGTRSSRKAFGAQQRDGISGNNRSQRIALRQIAGYSPLSTER